MPLPAYPRGMTRHPLVAVPEGMLGEENSTTVAPAARDEVAALVSTWEFKRRAGFETPAGAPMPELEGVLAKRVFGIRFAEPVRVVWADASGFGYETRPGHPIYGEESFRIDERGVFTARSVSRPSTWFWRMLAPALRRMQRSTHAEYVRIVQEAARAAEAETPR
ncbi:DUF1990 family protein [Microbacterium aurugineum]|uniref:DUF1990 family protein n=1 Tax=Microbacterium aurugineum TaxID=2851642 RepID=UPI0020C172EB|nr:DUF1990 family protein [Microbacterium aurugineum]MCK8477801.1 DUF1990 domain-containing protein [Microbacterium aurugineum]